MTENSFTVENIEALEIQLEDFHKNVQHIQKQFKEQIFKTSPGEYTKFYNSLVALEKTAQELRENIVHPIRFRAKTPQGKEVEERFWAATRKLNHINKTHFQPVWEEAREMSIAFQATEYLADRLETITIKATDHDKTLNAVVRKVILQKNLKPKLISNQNLYLADDIPVKFQNSQHIKIINASGRIAFDFHFQLENTDPDLVIAVLFLEEPKSKTYTNLQFKCFLDFQKSNIISHVKKELELMNAAPFNNKLSGFPILRKKAVGE